MHVGLRKWRFDDSDKYLIQRSAKQVAGNTFNKPELPQHLISFLLWCSTTKLSDICSLTLYYIGSLYTTYTQPSATTGWVDRSHSPKNALRLSTIIHDVWMVTVSCDDGDLRLVGGETEYEGLLEVCFSQRWGTVNGDGWSASDTQVACRQLGVDGK